MKRVAAHILSSSIRRAPCRSASTSASAASTAPARIFSGIQPTGTLHLGNYMGAVRNWVDLQNKGSLFLSAAGHKGDGAVSHSRNSEKGNEVKVADITLAIVDLHAVTLPQDPEELRNSVLRMAASLIGCGIDPEKSTLFIQSQVSQHAELNWLLGCVSSYSWLLRMTQFKDKSAQHGKSTVGLFTYPILQSADILVHKATHVPVGEDQLQHLELSRSIARSFNTQYGREVFPIPAPLLTDTTRVMSLRDATSKMSKSAPSDLSRINITDSAELISKKIKKAKTDSLSGISYDPESRPSVANLLSIYSAVSGRSQTELAREYADSQMSLFKEHVAEAVVSHVCPIGEEISRLEQDRSHLASILTSGAEKAREQASQTLSEVKDVMGLLQ